MADLQSQNIKNHTTAAKNADMAVYPADLIPRWGTNPCNEIGIGSGELFGSNRLNIDELELNPIRRQLKRSRDELGDDEVFKAIAPNMLALMEEFALLDNILKTRRLLNAD